VPVNGGCLCGGGMVNGSYFRVGELGYGWLVPDEQVDVNYNPAAINNIEGKRLFLSLSTDNNFDLKVESERKFFGFNAFMAVPVKKVKFACQYKPLLTFYSSAAGYETIKDEFVIMMFLGYPIKYNLKIGLSFGVNTNDEDYLQLIMKNYVQNYNMKVGIIYNINEFWNVGGSFGGILGSSNYINNDEITEKNDNLFLTLSILPEFIYFKHDKNIILRSLLTLSYDSVLSEFSRLDLWINEDESYYNLNAEIGLGLYYETRNKTVITFGTKYNQIFNNKNRDYGVNTIITTEYSGFDVSVFAGIEKTILVDWVLFRAGYNVLKMKNYNYNYYKEKNNVLVTKLSWTDFLMIFLPELNDNISMGISAKIGDNVLFNFSFGKNLFNFHSSDHNVEPMESIITGFDAELNFAFE
jgi:hypothetical protein